MKRWLISLIVTPERIRKWIAKLVSWLLYRCMLCGAWEVVSAFPKWLRKMADFIDRWNATELPREKDELITRLVKDAVTDEAVDKLIDKVAAMEVKSND